MPGLHLVSDFTLCFRFLLSAIVVIIIVIIAVILYGAEYKTDTGRGVV